MIAAIQRNPPPADDLVGRCDGVKGDYWPNTLGDGSSASRSAPA
jgi:hypothetical protein